MRLVLAVVVLSLSACALQSPLAMSAANLKDRRLTTAVRRAPPLSGIALSSAVYTAGALGGLVGVVGVAAATSEAGERVVRENHVSDPALTIARELGNSLQQRYGLRSSPIVLAAVDDDPTKIGLVDPAADLVLDVWTEDWGMARVDQVGPDHPGFGVNYQVNLRLIDAKVVRPIDGKAGAVIAEGTCTSNSEGTPSATQDELLADSARRLKAELDAAARYCVEDFRSRILAVEP